MSHSSGAAMAGIGFSFMAGSRFGNQGEALLLKHSFLKGTTSRSDIRIARDIENSGAAVGVKVGREQMMISMMGDPDKLFSLGCDSLAESIMSLKTVDWNVLEIKTNYVAKELQSLPADKLITDQLHAAAFGQESSLGRPLYTSSSGNINGTALDAYLSGSLAAPGSLKFIGAGIPHEQLVTKAKILFGSIDISDHRTKSPSPYIGGQTSLKVDIPMTHVAVAIPGAAYGSEDYAASLVLKELLGVGSFNFNYLEAGLIGIMGVTYPSRAEDMAVSFAKSLTASYSEEEIKAAKTAVKTNMLLDLEDAQKCISLLASTADLTQDLDSIENVTAASVEAFKSRSPPSMVSSFLHSTQTLKTLMRPSTLLSRLLLALPRQYYLLTRISSAFSKSRSQFNSDGTKTAIGYGHILDCSCEYRGENILM